MTNTGIDSIIKADLAALGDSSRQGMPGIDEALASVDRGTYRDGTAGAEARRDKLLATRRLELALMPLATGRIFVHRVARAVAGATATMGALLLAVVVYDAALSRLAAQLVPGGFTPLVAVLAIAAAAKGMYVIAGLIAERVFDRRMREVLETTGDAFDDIDSLARGPLEEARRLCNQVDGYSIALPLIGIATCAPLFAFFALVWSPRPTWGFTPMTGVMAVDNLGYVLLGSLIAAVLAVVVARACHREHQRALPSIILRVAGHWAVIPLALTAGLVTLVLLGRSLSAFSAGVIPEENLRLFVAIVGTLAVIAPITWIGLWLRRLEQRRLEGQESMTVGETTR